MSATRSARAPFVHALVVAATLAGLLSGCKGESHDTHVARPGAIATTTAAASQGETRTREGSDVSNAGAGRVDVLHGLATPGGSSPGKTSATTELPFPSAPVTAATRAVVTATGVIAPVVRENSDGSVVVGTPCGEQRTVHNVKGLGPVEVLVDPGGGGTDDGRTGRNGLREKDLNLVVARWAADALNASGSHAAVLVRTSDYTMTTKARAALVKAIGPKVFLSLRHDAGVESNAKSPGSEIYYQHASAASRRLAGLVLEEIDNTLTIYGDISWRADKDTGAKQRVTNGGADYYGLLRSVPAIPGVIAELAGIAQSEQAELLAHTDVQREEGIAIARAVNRYFDTTEAGRGFVDKAQTDDEAEAEDGACVDPPLE